MNYNYREVIMYKMDEEEVLQAYEEMHLHNAVQDIVDLMMMYGESQILDAIAVAYENTLYAHLEKKYKHSMVFS
jgi:hypothetical protein